jgi:basic membrane lipoprotein Med (substrate-binding protein (PBP1-ABC) superfamily)
MRKLIFILFMGLIALICGPPKLFASANNTTKKFKAEKKEAGAIASTIYNQDFSWTKTAATGEQPSLPEYRGNTNYTIDLPAAFARLPGTKIFGIYTNNLKNKPIPGFGRRLHQEA